MPLRWSLVLLKSLSSSNLCIQWKLHDCYKKATLHVSLYFFPFLLLPTHFTLCKAISFIFNLVPKEQKIPKEFMFPGKINLPRPWETNVGRSLILYSLMIIRTITCILSFMYFGWPTNDTLFTTCYQKLVWSKSS